MILKAPPPVPALGKVKLFISQPRRIAAKALVERVRSVRPRISEALRMGHDCANTETKTQGLVRDDWLPGSSVDQSSEKFNGISHLIIDEVRKVCRYGHFVSACRRLLKTNEAYSASWFSCQHWRRPCTRIFWVRATIKVGARRFPVKRSIWKI
jgi:hypothetical protein